MACSVLRIVISIVFLTCIFGCGRDSISPTVRANGKITYNGQPLPNVGVTFSPRIGRPGTGITNAEGNYVITTFWRNDGAVPGEHVVTISSHEVVPMPTSEEEETSPELLFPAKYSDPERSGLRAQVEKGAGPFNFDLVD